MPICVPLALKRLSDLRLLSSNSFYFPLSNVACALFFVKLCARRMSFTSNRLQLVFRSSAQFGKLLESKSVESTFFQSGKSNVSERVALMSVKSHRDQLAAVDPRWGSPLLRPVCPCHHHKQSTSCHKSALPCSRSRIRQNSGRSRPELANRLRGRRTRHSGISLKFLMACQDWFANPSQRHPTLPVPSTVASPIPGRVR